MPRGRPTLARERWYWREGKTIVCGVDEVGRGPLAGPVVAAAVVFPPECRPIRGLNDSKVLSPQKREQLAKTIRQRATVVAVGAASVEEVDRLNIRQASILAMRRAIAKFDLEPEVLLVDGLPIRELGIQHEAIVHGDAKCSSIAAASVVAKVVRDRLMERLGARYPVYGWQTNMGYATTEHLVAVQQYGPSVHHRRSFEPVRQLRLDL